MQAMRPLLIALALSAATPAAAQVGTVNQFQLDNLQAQQEAAQRAAVAQANQLMSLEANLRAQQAINELQFQRALPARLPELPYPQSAGASEIDISKLPSIPDAALAASNKRVQDVVKKKR
jgi:hypothetical protein